MRAPVSSLRTLSRLRAGVAVAPRSGRSPAAPARPASTPWINRVGYLLPFLLLAALAACDGSGPTGPEPSPAGVPDARGREAVSITPR